MLEISLKEFESIKYEKGKENYLEENVLHLKNQTIEALWELNQKINFLRIGRDEIKAKNWVGLVQVDNLKIQIYPKFAEDKSVALRNLLKMLMIGEELGFKDADINSISEMKFDSFLEILIAIYSIKLLETLRGGEYREYVYVAEERSYVKGQIDFPKYVRQWERRYRIPIRYNDRNLNNLINMTLKYTAFMMEKYTSSQENYRRLHNAINLMDAVDLKPIDAQTIDNIYFTRLNEYLHPLVNMARLFLANIIIQFISGRRKIFAFFLPMERVFEKFIANTLIKEKLINQDLSIKIQYGKKHLLKSTKGERLFLLIPDIIILPQNKNYSAIIDTKYKLLDGSDKKAGVSQSDAYQMFAYSQMYKAKKVMLLYPKIKEEISRNWVFEDNDNELLIRTVDLNIDLVDSWKEFIQNMKGIINDLLGECSN